MQPRTLIQKTLSEASKIQKAMYQSRMFPPTNGGKIPKPSCTLTSSMSANCDRVSVNTVPKRVISGPSNRTVPPSQASSSSLTPRRSFSRTTGPGSALASTTIVSTIPKHSGNISPKKLPTASSISANAGPMKQAPSIKKDPMASLFVPKHRAYSQRPV